MASKPPRPPRRVTPDPDPDVREPDRIDEPPPQPGEPPRRERRDPV
ncbi:hypothetical protein WJS89_02630 [Sphingomicrobium sp. XHP0235]